MALEAKKITVSKSGVSAEREPNQARLLRQGRSTLITDLGDSLTTKNGSVFALCAPSGDIDSNKFAGHGLYFHDMRYLDQAILRLNNREMGVLLASAHLLHTSISELTNPEIKLPNGNLLPKESLGIKRERALGPKVIETVTVQNYATEDVDITLTFCYGSCFDDMFVVRGAEPGNRGKLYPPRWQDNKLILSYDGADGHKRRTILTFSPMPNTRLSIGHAIYHLHIPKRGQQIIRVEIELLDQSDHKIEARPKLAKTATSFEKVKVSTDNPLFDRVLKRAFDDLSILQTTQHKDTFLAAGIPWYVALFGRDNLIAGIQLLAFDFTIAANILSVLAKYQGKEINELRDEEPGKIPHELRIGEMANLKEIPQTPYYGTADATPLYLILMAEYVKWSGDIGLYRKLEGNVRACLEWIDKYADHDNDGFYDYICKASKGLSNQGWKDSGNSIAHSDGTFAEPPIALVELQGYVYKAWLSAAYLERSVGNHTTAEELEKKAYDLKNRFNQAFWMPERNYYAIALEKGGRQVDSVASNPGHALWSEIIEKDKAEHVAKTLLSEPMFSGWGIRTLAETEGNYNPIDYQVGAVWPHDNSIIIAGLKKYGYTDEALTTFSALFEAAVRFPNYRLPEIFAGFSRKVYPVPVRYPVACNPQAWAAGAIPYILATILGLEANALNNELLIKRPALPPWLDEVTIKNLRVGNARVSLKYKSDEHCTLVAVLEKHGDIAIKIEY